VNPRYICIFTLSPLPVTTLRPFREWGNVHLSLHMVSYTLKYGGWRKLRILVNALPGNIFTNNNMTMNIMISPCKRLEIKYIPNVKKYKMTEAFNYGNALQYLHMKCIQCKDPISETLCSLMFFRVPDDRRIKKKIKQSRLEGHAVT
jgi:hypothetical protein